MFHKLFEDLIKEKKQFLNSSTGTQFEDRIRANLKKNRFSEIFPDLISTEDYKRIKKQILDKRKTDLVLNDLEGAQFKNCFIYQPYGKQDFPDFLIFTEKYIVALEIKYSTNKNKSPMWNSNLPKANAIYIFGSYKIGDITFFKGSDILPEEERNLLLGFFDETEKLQNSFEKRMKVLFQDNNIKQDKGFFVYVRKAYTQKKLINKDAEKDYFNFSNRKELEENVVLFAKAVSSILEKV